MANRLLCVLLCLALIVAVSVRPVQVSAVATGTALTLGECLLILLGMFGVVVTMQTANNLAEELEDDPVSASNIIPFKTAGQSGNVDPSLIPTVTVLYLMLKIRGCYDSVPLVESGEPYGILVSRVSGRKHSKSWVANPSRGDFWVTTSYPVYCYASEHLVTTLNYQSIDFIFFSSSPFSLTYYGPHNDPVHVIESQLSNNYDPPFYYYNFGFLADYRNGDSVTASLPLYEGTVPLLDTVASIIGSSRYDYGIYSDVIGNISTVQDDVGRWTSTAPEDVIVVPPAVTVSSESDKNRILDAIAAADLVDINQALGIQDSVWTATAGDQSYQFKPNASGQLEPIDAPQPDPDPDPSSPSDPSEPTEPDDDDNDDEQKPIPIVADLRKYFPFCLPFDAYDFLSCLASDPVAPVIDYDLPLPGGDVYTLHLDFSQFDTVALILRRMELLAFIIMLALNTRRMFTEP